MKRKSPATKTEKMTFDEALQLLDESGEMLANVLRRSAAGEPETKEDTKTRKTAMAMLAKVSRARRERMIGPS
jgi:hypothetical protein